MTRKCRHNTMILILLAMAAAAPPLIKAQSPIVLRNPMVVPEISHGKTPPLRANGQTAANSSNASPDVMNRTTSGSIPSSQSSAQPDVYIQNFQGVKLPVTVALNFEGINAGGPQEPFPAPDPNGAVGATQYVEWINAQFEVFNKQTGQREYGPVAAVSLFKTLSGPCSSQNTGDGIVQYDKAAGRWIITHRVGASNSGPYYQCIAVSQTSDATKGWYTYSFQIAANEFPDYPKLAVWPDAYYETANLLSPTNGNIFLGSLVCAFDRVAMLAGQSATAQCFTTSNQYESLLPSDLDGNTPPPSGSPNYLMNLGANSLGLWEFRVDFQNSTQSTLTGPTNIPVAAFTDACSLRQYVCIPQAGSSEVLDSIGDRLMYRLAYRNFGDYESLVVAHSVNPSTQAYAGIRWYEIRSPASNPFVYQQGTFSPDANSRWLASAAMDQAGNMAIGYSVSSSTLDPSMMFTGRLATDPLGTLESEVGVVKGSGAELAPDFRWGDYSSMVIDPTDDCTFWFTSEYLTTIGTNNWKTRVVAFKFNSCP